MPNQQVMEGVPISVMTVADYPLPSTSEMRLAAIHHSNKEINQAGKILADLNVSQNFIERTTAMTIVEEWRASHAYPLRAVKTLLKQNARKFGNAVVSGRPKRMPSIISKLQRNENMQLVTMHDVGGCRAVLPSINQVKALANITVQ